MDYTPVASTFRLWAPSATRVDLVELGRVGADGDAGDGTVVHPMTRLGDGMWELTLPGDHESMRYRFRRHGDVIQSCPGMVPAEYTEFTDPEAIAVTANGTAAVVTRREPWSNTRPPAPEEGAEIIYEAHVRDLTIDPRNGIAHPGTFLGLSEPGTRTPRGALTGLDYLCSLGVTHIQFLPIFDFATVDETGDRRYGAQYNWGYDPANYNAVEGSYSTDPTNPQARIVELKRLIDTLHARGLRVIMDVVYNHVYDTTTNPLALAEADGYFRLRLDGTHFNGTGCGSETASEKPRMHDYLIKSVRHWALTYGIDGFRFDLMGIHDVATMRAVRDACDDIDPTILLLGEGWVMGHHPGGVVPADYRHADKLERISFFNDSLRDTVRGDNFRADVPGFASWATGDYEAVLLWDNIIGAQSARVFASPLQSIVYTEAHDNLTLFDKLTAVAEGAGGMSDEEIERRHRLALTIQYLANGRVFIHAGQEFLRTKGGDDNSYRSGDDVNALRYDRALDHAETVELFRSLNSFRRRHRWVRLTSFDEINSRYELLHYATGLLSYRVADAWGIGVDAYVVINATTSPIAIVQALGETAGGGSRMGRHTKWMAHIFDHVVYPEPQPLTQGDVPGLSVAVLSVSWVGVRGSTTRAIAS